jgi:hypothetical protein
MTDWRGILLYARTHGADVYLLGTSAAIAALCITLHTNVSVGNLDGTATTSLSAAVAMVIGILAGGTWTARNEQLDHLLTRSPARIRHLHPILVILLSGVLTALAAWTVLGQFEAGAEYLRSGLLWGGLSIVSAVIIGGAFSWVVPVGYLLVLANVGYDESGFPRWWNIAFRPSDEMLSWAICAGVAFCAITLARFVPHRR